MAIKKLFEGHKLLSKTNRADLTSEIEGEAFIGVHDTNKDRFLPNIDFSSASNFTKFGSAEKYYEDSIKRIYNTYPYDGALIERTQWFNSSSYLDLYILNNVYPTTNGYAIFSPTDWGTLAGTSSNGYAAPASASYEYILSYGGPNAGTNIKYSDSPNNNIWDDSKQRTSNLAIGGGPNLGNTVEFWLKKKAFDTENQTGREVIFDVHTTSSNSSSANYGRLTIEMTGGLTTTPFLVTYMSGTSGFAEQSIGSSNATTTFVAGNTWHHYAFVFHNTGSDVSCKLYIDGQYDHKITADSTNVNYVSGAIVSTIGSLVASPSASSDGERRYSADAPARGWGKLSASIDEFRFWKNPRTSRDIGRHWFTQVQGGTNTIDANINLGIYYKFNEGINNTSSVQTEDKTVLDYSGRVSNGTWTGYVLGSRNTASAIVEADAATQEYKDPIIYSIHPEVNNLLVEKKKIGELYDRENNAGLYNMIPQWITEEDDGTLLQLTQILSSYFDTLFLQIESLTELKNTSYPSTGSRKPLPFSHRLLESKGFITPDLFADAETLENIGSRSETEAFEQKLHDTKNLIYQNIYNNLTHIYKSKGTETAFRNLLHCFGIDENVVKLNLYGENATYELKDNYRTTLARKNYVDFNASTPGTYLKYEATVYQQTSSKSPSSVAFISASRGNKKEAGFPATVEAEVMFPKKFEPASDLYVDYPHYTSSLFGMHTAHTASGRLTVVAPDYANFQVYAVRKATQGSYSATEQYSGEDAYFRLTGSIGGFIPDLTSSVFRGVYTNKKWNFAVRVKPTNYPLVDFISGSDAVFSKTYTVEFYGVNAVADTVAEEFLVTGTMSYDNGINFMTTPKRLYIGAHRTNFTGTILQRTDVKISSLRYWMDYLSNDVIKLHAHDALNFGAEDPYKNAYLFQNTISTGSTAIYVPKIDTLALHWDFETVSGSNSDGQFLVPDAATGSATLSSRYSWLGNIIKNKHTGKGNFFYTSDSGSIEREYVHSVKSQLPETLNSKDMINIELSIDKVFTKDHRPGNLFFAFEKSMYQTISDEVIKYFASVKDFNNLIGEPINRYRQEYKDLSKLRQLFFERIDNTPDIDRYVSYYKWVDSAIGDMLLQLIPAAANFSPNLRTIVESHVLERNKYWTKFPTLEMKTAEPDAASLLGGEDARYNWKFGHAPIPSGDIKAEVVNLLTIAGNNNNDRFKVNVPTAAGGTGVDITVKLVAGTPSSSTANQVEVSTAGTGAALLARLVTAIAGGTPSPSNSVAYGSGAGDVTNGIAGITAAEGTSNRITITATQLGITGNGIVFTDIIGVMVENGASSSPATLTGGTDEQAQYNNCLWWKDRAERSDASLSSGDSNIDADKNSILKTFTTVVSRSGPNLSSSFYDVDNYEGSSYALRKFSKPYKLFVKKTQVLHGGINYSNNKKPDFYKTLQGFGSSSLKPVLYTQVSRSFTGSAAPLYGQDLELFQDCTDAYDLYKNDQTKARFGATIHKDNKKYKGDLLYPFNIHSSSISPSYLSSRFTNYGYQPSTASTGPMFTYDITNIHADIYGPDYETPMQGPFTEKFVGGNQHRHININSGAMDAKDNRPEAFRIGLNHHISVINPAFREGDPIGSFDSTLPRASFYRDGTAKRPVNIRNIRQTTGSSGSTGVRYETQIGNYMHDYEILHTSGRRTNNRAFVKNEGFTLEIVESAAVSGVFDFTLPNRAVSGTNKFVFVERFSAPGGPEVMSRGYLDVESEEYAVQNMLNYRNFTVREPLRLLYTDHVKQFGYFSDQHNSASYFLADQTYFPGTSGSVSETTYHSSASFYKTNRNSRKRIVLSGSHTGSSIFSGDPFYGGEAYLTATVHDNYWVQHQIPRSDKQYAWITASMSGNLPFFGYEEPDRSNAGGASTSITFISESEVAAVGQGGSRLLTANALQYGAAYYHRIKVDFVGMNLVMHEPISASQNTLGYPPEASIDGRSLAASHISGILGNHTIYSPSTTIGPNYYLSISDAVKPRYSLSLDYVNYDEGMCGLNGLLHHRGGNYGYPSWKQIRTGEHPVARLHRKKNILSIQDAPKTKTFIIKSAHDGKGKSSNVLTSSKAIRGDTFTHYSESVCTSKFKPISQTFVIETENGKLQPLSVRHTYANNLVKFVNCELNNKLGITSPNLNQKYYKLLSLYDPDLITLPKESNPIKKFGKLLYRETIYPKEKYTYFNKARSREMFVAPFWRKDRGTTHGTQRVELPYENPGNGRATDLVTASITNSQGLTIARQSRWPLDARLGFLTASTDILSGGFTGAGELLNNYQVFSGNIGSDSDWQATPASKPYGALYARPIASTFGEVYTSQSARAEIFTNDTLWEAGAQAGKDPFPENYNTWADQMRRCGKDYTIIPEFRISEHMPFYINEHGGNFRAENPKFLSLTGSSISSSGEANFYTTYSNTEFLKYFDQINDDHVSVSDEPHYLGLQCKAYMKFLPYDGFYPALRTLQLATLFSESYGPTVELSGTQKSFRTALTPFFAPGILYNSIKSGMSVDYPVHTGSFVTTGSSRNDSYESDRGGVVVAGIPRIKTLPRYRMPFEAIIDPSKYGGILIVDAEPHPHAHIDSTASIKAAHNQLYTLGMHNFLAAVPDFFLAGGKLTTALSAPEKDPNYFNVVSGATYVMHVELSHGTIRNSEIVNGGGDGFSDYTPWRPSVALKNLEQRESNLIYNPPTIKMYERTASIDSYGSSFGPPYAVGSLLSDDIGPANSLTIQGTTSASYSSHTPPYYNGSSRLKFTLTITGALAKGAIGGPIEGMPDKPLRLTLTEIMNNCNIIPWRIKETKWMSHYWVQDNGTDVHNTFASPYAAHKGDPSPEMKPDSCLNFLQLSNEPSPTFDADGNITSVSSADNQRWAIQPKWECPILDFSGSIVTLPQYGTASIAKGMWHQYGQIPTGSNKGVFMDIIDPTDIGVYPNYKSLADLVGFDTKKSYKLGTVAEMKTVLEAVVAIPFVEEGVEKKFFTLDRAMIKEAIALNVGATKLEDIEEAKRPGVSIRHMVNSMKNYVFPPQFDFLTYPDINPIAMYLFNFGVKFTQKDLADMWQNLPPDMGMDPKTPFKTAHATVNHQLLANEFYKSTDGRVPSKLRWMVFKVKQRGKSNYYKLTSDSKDDAKFKFKFEQGGKTSTIEGELPYSYNWPYDYFSLVELVKIDARVTIPSTTEQVSPYESLSTVPKEAFTISTSPTEAQIASSKAAKIATSQLEDKKAVQDTLIKEDDE